MSISPVARGSRFVGLIVSLAFRSFFVLRSVRARIAVMNMEKEREIIRLWNRLRLLQREGRPTAAVRRQIEKALAERDEAA
jgi:hypothetical protein